jgi:hypothetical protein
LNSDTMDHVAWQGCHLHLAGRLEATYMKAILTLEM